MEKHIQKANVLIESLPYIRGFYNKTFVIKYGGSSMEEESIKREFAKDIVLLKYIGINPVVVHGGGPQIGDFLARLGKETKFVDGLRVTDAETMEVVEMVLAGKVNKELVSLINNAGGKAVGLSGKDGELIIAKKMIYKNATSNKKGEKSIDMGLIGDIKEINTGILQTLYSNQFIPVIAPIGTDKDGNTYNINADTVASEVAGALKAEKLILLTNVSGVLDKDGKLIPTMSGDESEKLIKDGDIKGGMIPKVKCCTNALQKGVQKTHIIDGRIAHALLIEIFTNKGIGTQLM